jgi:deoxyribonuclease-4|tara:strand:+ start:544 stop:1377 length:834 start_codon:yes stop_codon:yes gene_type:complete
VILGSQTSAENGLASVFDKAQQAGADCLQIFSKPSQRWIAPPLKPDEIDAFCSARFAAGGPPVLVHDSYLINLASPDPDKLERSIEAYAHELQRCHQLGLEDLNMHPGAATDGRESDGLNRVADALLEAYLLAGDPPVRTIFETTAGQGSNLGYRFEHLRDLLARVWDPDRFAVCIDTCHIFVAGYDWSSEEGYDATFEAFHRIVGLDRLAWFHLNDSAKALGSRVDRHAEIGAGYIGLEPFRWLVNDSRFVGIPGVLETPNNRFKENLDCLKSLRV